MLGLAGLRDERSDGLGRLRFAGAQHHFGAFGNSRPAERQHDRVAGPHIDDQLRRQANPDSHDGSDADVEPEPDGPA